MSVFETVAIDRGRAIFLGEHLDRLGQAARAMGWDAGALPGIPDLPAASGVLRLYVTAGPGRPGDDFCGTTYALLEEVEVGAAFPALRVGLSAAVFVPAPGGWKTGNYWQNVQALAAAHQAGLEDALVFNAPGALVGATMANVFLKIDGVWKTPALGTGARDGVVRAWVLGQIPAEEAWLEAGDVALATEGFLTNSRVGVRAICELDGRPLHTDVAGLQRAYRTQLLE